MKDRYIIGVIGAGNMGEALIKGLLKSQLVRSYEVIASGRSKKRLSALERTYGVHTTLDNNVVVASTDTLIIAVKPQNMSELYSQIKSKITPAHLIISIAAGVDIAHLRKGLGEKAKFIRVMPNLPVVVDNGVSAIFSQPKLPERYRRFAHQIFQAVGSTVDVRDEKMMDAITALSGTGPAYVFALMEAMQSAGEKLGLKGPTARELTLQTIVGAAELSFQSASGPEELRRKVTSKKGTTWAAMKIFQKRGFWKLIEDAMKAAAKRSAELRKGRTP